MKIEVQQTDKLDLCAECISLQVCDFELGDSSWTVVNCSSFCYDHKNAFIIRGSDEKQTQST